MFTLDWASWSLSLISDLPVGLIIFLLVHSMSLNSTISLLITGFKRVIFLLTQIQAKVFLNTYQLSGHRGARAGSVVKGWGGHREGTRFEFQWRQRVKENKNLPIKKNLSIYLYMYVCIHVCLYMLFIIASKVFTAYACICHFIIGPEMIFQ